MKFTAYLKNLGSNNAEGNIKETDVGSWYHIFHKEPMGHSLVILAEVPEIIQGTP